MINLLDAICIYFSDLPWIDFELDHFHASITNPLQMISKFQR